MTTMKVIRPATTNGKIGAVSMVISLVNSGVPLEKIALAKTLTAEQMIEVKAATR